MRWSRFKIFNPANEWWPWFAWYPVLLADTDEWVWLEKIEKMRVWNIPGSYTQYRDKQI